MCRYVVLMLSVVGASAGAVRAYAVDPVKASWSGWTGFQDTVSQGVTCCWDTLKYVDLFVGFHGAGGNYNLTVKEVEGGQPVASQLDLTPGRNHTWLKFDDIDMEPGESFTKGKRYEFRFTRSGNDSIQYYYCEAADGGPYKYGEMATGNSVSLNADLCARVYGVMDTVGRDWVGMDPSFPVWEDPVGQNTRRVKWVGFCESAGVGLIRFTVNWAAMQ